MNAVYSPELGPAPWPKIGVSVDENRSLVGRGSEITRNMSTISRSMPPQGHSYGFKSSVMVDPIAANAETERNNPSVCGPKRLRIGREAVASAPVRPKGSQTTFNNRR
jgi:hypothetical protein